MLLEEVFVLIRASTFAHPPKIMKIVPVCLANQTWVVANQFECKELISDTYNVV